MAKQDVIANVQPGPFQRLKEFMTEVRSEMKKVTWPTKEDLKVSTKVTMFLLGVMAVITFFFDQIFGNLIILLLGMAS
jgi:preprotein translocase subunit SecE